MSGTPSAQYSLTLRVQIEHRPGMLGRVASAIGAAGGTIGAVEVVRVEGDQVIRDFAVQTSDAADWPRLTAAVDAVAGARVLEATDRTFELHRGGKIEVALKLPLRTRDDLSMAYTPGVARVCSAIAADRERAFEYTIKRNTVAVVSDGTAVLGLGDIGPYAAMPVMEGKAMLFKEFAGVDAFPICLDTKDPDEIVAAVRAIAPGFGGINLEDISAPRCFEIEERLQRSLDIPVFHDDQHGTAVVTLAALINSLKLTGRRIGDLRILISGAGAAGIAVAKILLSAGASGDRMILCDSRGALSSARSDYLGRTMPASKRELAELTNPDQLRGGLAEAIAGTDVFIGLSGARVLPASALAAMNGDAIVFAMANPDPEVDPEEAAGHVRVLATGRSDYPNQINNVLAFPGIFRGALDVRATRITEEMKVAAAHAIAATIAPEELREDYIIPSVLNRDVMPAVADAVAREAHASGVAAAAGEGSARAGAGPASAGPADAGPAGAGPASAGATLGAA